MKFTSKQEFLAHLKSAEGEERKDLHRQMRAQVGALPEKQGLVLSLKWYEHMSDKEIGRVLDMPTERITKLHEEAIDLIYRGFGGAA